MTGQQFCKRFVSKILEETDEDSIIVLLDELNKFKSIVVPEYDFEFKLKSI